MPRRWNQTALCAVLCALLLAGCSGSPSSDSSTAPVVSAAPSPSAAPQRHNTLVLGHTPGSGYNPYLTNSTLVAQNASLLFEKLVEIDPNMHLDYRIASSVQCTGNTVTISVRSGCQFADGTPITAQDVAASLQAARTSTRYAARFAAVQAVEAKGDAVLVQLSSPDSLFAYLCDIPVLKAAETGLSQPTASGRYTYGADSSTLVKNSYATLDTAGPDTIQLVEVSGYDEMVSGLSMGRINLYTASETAQSSSSVSSRTSYYKTNNLVFLGVNGTPGDQKSLLLTTSEGRAFLSKIISRRQLAEESFYGRAYPATGIINDYYDCVRSQHIILAQEELTAQQADEILTGWGYQKDPQTGYYQTSDGKRLELRLLVYSGSTYKRYAASLLKEQLAACGIYTVLEEQSDFTAYCEKIAAGDFDLYIGEVKLYNNMDMSPFFHQGQASWGIVQSDALAAAYAAFKADASAAGAFEQAFAAEMPLVPLLWRSGTVVHDRWVSGVDCSLSDVFYSLENIRFDQGT